MIIGYRQVDVTYRKDVRDEIIDAMPRDAKLYLESGSPDLERRISFRFDSPLSVKKSLDLTRVLSEFGTVELSNPNDKE